MTITGPTTYSPGQTYTIQVHAATSDDTRRAWGFELTTLSPQNTAAGTFTNTTAFTAKRTGSGRNYIEQNEPGSFQGQSAGATWTFAWTAPATNVGTVTFYVAGLHADNDGSDEGDQTYTRNVSVPVAPPVVIRHGFSDFDGDGRADPAVFRPSTGIWYVNRSTAGFTAFTWGLPSDRLTPADFDGDDKTDYAVWREDLPEKAAFYIFQSSSNTFRVALFGQNGDDPRLVGDWDGDGKADPAVFRDSAIGAQSYFFFLGSANNPSETITYLPFGMTGDRGLRGDFDGDGKMDACVYRESDLGLYIRMSGGPTVVFERWGLPSDRFVPADYDGDGKTDLAVFRGGNWYIKQSSNGQVIVRKWGNDTDLLVPADYDGDGKTDPAVYRNGTWWLNRSTAGTTALAFGLGSDFPVEGAFSN